MPPGLRPNGRRDRATQPLLVGPDAESAQWVKDVADRVGAPSIVMRKERRSDRVVEISAPDMAAYRQHTPVVVDDVVSSAQTMIETVKCLVRAGLRPPVCVAVHALFSDMAEQGLRGAGAASIVTTTSVPHASNMIDALPLMIPPIRDLAGE